MKLESVTVPRKALVEALETIKLAVARKTKSTAPRDAWLHVTLSQFGAIVRAHSRDDSVDVTALVSGRCDERAWNARSSYSMFVEASAFRTILRAGKRRSGDTVALAGMRRDDRVAALAVEIHGERSRSFEVATQIDSTTEPFPTAINLGDRKPLAAYEYEGAELCDAITYCARAMSDDDARIHLNGVQLQPQRAVATDGHRLHVAELEFPGEAFLHPVTVAATMRATKPRGANAYIELHSPRDSDSADLVTLRSVADGYTLRIDQRIRADHRFPPVDAVIPELEKTTGATSAPVVAFRDPFATAHKIADRARGVQLTVTDGAPLRLDVDNPGERSSYSEVVTEALAMNTNGTHAIGVWPAYVTDALHGMGPDERITLSWSDPLAPLRIDANKRIAVVMPMRI